MNKIMICCATAAALLLACGLAAAREGDAPKPARFATEIAAFEKWDSKNSWPSGAVLFVGSSSVRLWQTADSFPSLPVINRGFGGSMIVDANHYFDRVVQKYEPRVIVFYSGDNDIANGKSPRRVFDDFQTFLTRVRETLPQTPVLFISIKPSIARLKLWPRMAEANALVKKLADDDSRLVYVDVASPMLAGKEVPPKDLFLQDGLHLNAKGYELWNEALAPLLEKALESSGEAK